MLIAESGEAWPLVHQAIDKFGDNVAIINTRQNWLYIGNVVRHALFCYLRPHQVARKRERDAYVHKYVQKHIYIDRYIHKHTQKHTHTHTHTQIHTRTHTDAHTRTH